jgi:hypothetical protein
MKDKIKTYLDACNHLGIDPNDDIPYKNPKTSKQISVNAYIMLETIICCFNGDWKPNWSDSRESKYHPCFYNKSTGASHGIGSTPASNTTKNSSGFVFDGTSYDATFALVGSRLCFKNREDAEYCGKTFLFIYKDYMMHNDRVDYINEILK